MPLMTKVADQMIRYLLNITVVVRYSDRLLDRYLPADYPDRANLQLKIESLMHIVLVVLMLIPAIVGNLYVELTTFCGATVGVTLSFIIPVICFYRIRWPESQRHQKVCAWVVFIFGVGG